MAILRFMCVLIGLSLIHYNCAENSDDILDVNNISTNPKVVYQGHDEHAAGAIIAQLKADVEALQAKLGDISLGTTYVHWGRTDCPGTAELIYTGYVGRAFYVHGGGANYQCLSDDPELHSASKPRFHSGSYMYGVEYGESPVLRDKVVDCNALCAVCSVETRTQQLMIPGRYHCPSGWTEEYSGWLVAQKHDQGASSFACLDRDVQVDPDSARHQDAGIFRVVEAYCGSLPCPPYVPGVELSCVVCTK